MNVIDLLANNTLTNNPFGWVLGDVEITEEIILIPENEQTSIRGAFVRKDHQRKSKKQEWKKAKLITVRCIIDGVNYEKTKTFEDLNITVDDIGVEIGEKAEKPEIRIFLNK